MALVNLTRRISVGLRSLILVGALGFAAFQAYQTIKFSRAILNIRAGTMRESLVRTETAGNGGAESLTIPTVAERGVLDSVSLRGPALVFLYNTKCAPCAANMGLWTDLILDLRRRQPGIAVYAAGLDSVSAGEEYWGRLLDRGHVLQLRSAAAFDTIFHATGTPSTVLIRNGHVLAVYGGFMGRRRQMRVELLAIAAN